MCLITVYSWQSQNALFCSSPVSDDRTSLRWALIGWYEMLLMSHVLHFGSELSVCSELHINTDSVLTPSLKDRVFMEVDLEARLFMTLLIKARLVYWFECSDICCWSSPDQTAAVVNVLLHVKLQRSWRRRHLLLKIFHHPYFPTKLAWEQLGDF